MKIKIIAKIKNSVDMIDSTVTLYGCVSTASLLNAW